MTAPAEVAPVRLRRAPQGEEEGLLSYEWLFTLDGQEYGVRKDAHVNWLTEWHVDRLSGDPKQWRTNGFHAEQVRTYSTLRALRQRARADLTAAQQ